MTHFFDARLPRPLLIPSLWPEPDRDRQDLWILPLMETVISGGPLSSWVDRAQETGRIAWSVSLEVVASLQTEQSEQTERGEEPRLNAMRALVLATRAPVVFECGENGAEPWLGSTSFRKGLERAERALGPEAICLVAGRDAETLGWPAAPGFAEWVAEIFPNVISEIGWARMQALVQAYRIELPRSELVPREALRFFAGYLRRTRFSDEIVEMANLEWTRFEALFSPQDEVREAKSLSQGEIMVNPAAQILRLEREARFVVRHRVSGAGFDLCERTLAEGQAWVIDTVSEDFRVSERELIRRLGEAIRPSIESLVAAGVLLRGGALPPMGP